MHYSPFAVILSESSLYNMAMEATIKIACYSEKVSHGRCSLQIQGIIISVILIGGSFELRMNICAGLNKHVCTIDNYPLHYCGRHEELNDIHNFLFTLIDRVYIKPRC